MNGKLRSQNQKQFKSIWRRKIETKKTVRIEVLSEAKTKCFIDGQKNVAITIEKPQAE
jgi:hypothetical protein